MKEKIRRFMIGRYGVDQFSRFLMWFAFGSMIISMFFGKWIFYTIAILTLIYCYYRIFSKNFDKRYHENNFYMDIKNKFLNIFRRLKYNTEQRKIYHIYRCPKCKQKIRIPKGKGKICITCPKCRAEFIKKS